MTRIQPSAKLRPRNLVLCNLAPSTAQGGVGHTVRHPPHSAFPPSQPLFRSVVRVAWWVLTKSKTYRRTSSSAPPTTPSLAVASVPHAFFLPFCPVFTHFPSTLVPLSVLFLSFAVLQLPQDAFYEPPHPHLPPPAHYPAFTFSSSPFSIPAAGREGSCRRERRGATREGMR